jgi:thiosulfate dehydrogenase (quinone) large subunit
MSRLTRAQSVTLVLLRTLIGWHFLYEGYYKAALPAWSAAGAPLASWSASGYLKAASGPLASWFHAMVASGASGWVIGLSLLLGLFTQLGCTGALLLLALFYVAAIPTQGVPQSGAEGTYLLVNKTLIELVAVAVLLVFRTGRIAGLDVLRVRRATAP